MVLTGEAIKMLQKKYPRKRIISGIDMTDFYAFQMWDRSVNPKSVLNFPTSPTMYAIRKHGGAEFFFHAYASNEGTFAGEIDVMPYLSREDASFAKNVKSMLERAGGG